MSKAAKLLEIFERGESLTSKQISQRLNTKYPACVIRDVREMGYVVYRNPRTNSKGETKNFYRLGTPTRSMLARYQRYFGSDYTA